MTPLPAAAALAATATCWSRTRPSCRCSRPAVRAPDHILLKLRSGANADAVAARLRGLISDPTLRIRSYAARRAGGPALSADQAPHGHHLRLRRGDRRAGGLVIVYQVLSTDVADHLREYATFKAMGYGPLLHLGIILEEALILGRWASCPGIVGRHGALTPDGQAPPCRWP
jgi:putative ABC transport system permease protein